VKHDGPMTEVDVTFTLQDHSANAATYSAICPRCNTGEIVVTVALDAGGGFREAPACPTLCVDCEDRLDALLEGSESKGPKKGPGDRASLNAFLKVMNVRPWD
jgi:hypothetical protein